MYQIEVLYEQTQSDIVSSRKRKRSPLDNENAVDQSSKKQPKPKAPNFLSEDGTLSTTTIEHWLLGNRWPKVLFQPDPILPPPLSDPMLPQLARKKSLASLGRERSSTGTATQTTDGGGEKNREEKSAPYKDPQYVEQLELEGFYMTVDAVGPLASSLKTCTDLLSQRPVLPQDTLFDINVFKSACTSIAGRNESRVIHDFLQLIVPSAENLYQRRKITTEHLIESINEGWNLADSITQVRPQPDYSVGFGRKAFTEARLSKLRPYLGDSRTEVSRLRATWYMYFPFLSCEVKCGAGVLDVADRQNAHSMSIAARAVVDIYQLAGKEQTINRKILCFSISHNDQNVRIYGYYPIISKAGDSQAGEDNPKAGKSEVGEPKAGAIKALITFHRHLIKKFDIQDEDGKDRWRPYYFVHSIYQKWAPEHLKALITVIDALPENIGRNSLPTPSQETSTGLSQQIEESHIFEGEAAEPTPETSASVVVPTTSNTRPLAKRVSRK